MELSERIRLHTYWIDGEPGGVRFEEHGDLSRTNLTRTNLTYANLTGADLRCSNLRNTDLQGADLRCSNLQGSNLQGSNLQDTDLRNAILRGSDLTGAKLPHYKILPEGDLIGYKKLFTGTIAKLKIPADAKRMNPIGSRKCRAEFIDVIEG